MTAQVVRLRQASEMAEIVATSQFIEQVEIARAGLDEVAAGDLDKIHDVVVDVHNAIRIMFRHGLSTPWNYGSLTPQPRRPA